VSTDRRNSTDEDDDEQAEACGEYDPVDEAAFDAQQRLWVRTLVPVALAPAQHEWNEPRVRYAVEMAAIAAAERIGRICRGDLDQVEETE
jgi:hypothetical protein